MSTSVSTSEPATGSTAVTRSAIAAVVASVAVALGPAALAVAMLTALAGLSAVGLHAFVIPFAATAALVAIAPSSPLARPRNVLVGYLVSTVPALAVGSFIPPSTPTATAVGGLAIVAMLMLRAAHPPAVAGAVMIGLNGADWMFLLDGVAPALAAVLGLAFAAGVAFRGYEYPWRWR